MYRNVTRQFIKSPPKKEEIPKKRGETKQPTSKNVFIVHGRDHMPMKELKTMLYEFGLNPIVLHEKASGGLTLAEKLEKYSKDVGYVFVILTPDDVGAHKHGFYNKLKKLGAHIIEEELHERARQNVIFEMGYFWGLLKRKKGMLFT